ncbi:MAG: hypothetical protein ACK523_18035, partial [Pirellulaceae bacterium]
MRTLLVFCCAVFCSQQPVQLWAQDAPAGAAPQRGPQGPRGFGGPIELGPEDRQVFEDPPGSIIDKQEGIARGKLE